MKQANQYIFLIFIIVTLLSFNSFSQAPKFKSASWRDNWRIDFKTGMAALLTEVPDKYLDKINNVNIPKGTPGPAAFLAIRKAILPHFEIGYQFGYMHIDGKVTQSDIRYKVQTQALETNFMFIYNFKSTNQFRPLINYFAYYRIGGISLKNNPREILPDGSLSPVMQATSDDSFIKNVAVLTGIGFGMNYQFTNNLSIIGTFELNRSSDIASDVYRIQKLFYQSPNTVNNYITTSFGISYTYNLAKRKQSSFFKTNTETEKKLKEHKILKRKGKSSNSNSSIWQNKKGGK